MNPRLRKEFRGLLAPWSATLAAAMVMAVGLQSGPVFGNALRGWIKDLVTFFVGLSPVVFFGGIVVMSGAAFGMEFQHRTTALWLSQPTSRGRIWKDKMLTLSIAVVGSSLVAVVGLSLSQRLETEPWKDMELVIPGAALFFLTTVCGACYWTIVARSTMGGIVFSIGSQLGVVLVVVLGFEKLFGNNNRLQVGALTVAGLVYAAIFLVLGWRKFAAFELRDSTLGQGGFQFGSFATWFWRGWLQCAPRSKWANLVRKELGLSLPLFVIAAVFTACWLLSFGALWLMPTRRNGFEIVFAVMTGVYIPVMAVLSGSVGVIEEKSLSTHAWHLTLPLAGWRQWGVKLATGSCLGGVLGLLLPALLGMITVPELRTTPEGDSMKWAELLVSILAFWVPCFALSFWAATLVSTSARAALTAVLGVSGICFCVFLGTWCAEGLRGPQGEFAGWLYLLRLSAIARSLPPLLAFLVFVGPALATVLLQSLFQFRRVQTRSRVFFKYALIVAVVVFLTAFLSVA